MKFWQLMVGLGVGFLLFMSVFTSENQKLMLLSSLNNPLADQPRLVQIHESQDETQYFYTDKSQFLVVHPAGVVKPESDRLILKQGALFVAGGLYELGEELVEVGQFSFDIRNREVFVFLDPVQSHVHVYALDGSLTVHFAESTIPLFIPVGHKAVIPQDRYFLQQPTAFLGDELNQFFQVQPWYDDPQAPLIKDDQAVYQTWLGRFEDFARRWPFLWSSGSQTGLAAWTSYRLAELHASTTIGFSSKKQNEYALSKAMAYVIDGLYFFEQGKPTKQQQVNEKLLQYLASPDWQTFLQTAPEEAQKWRDYEQSFRFWLRGQTQTSSERSLLALFYSPSNTPIDQLEREWRDAETNLARLFLQKVTPHLIHLKNLSQTYTFTDQDRPFLAQKRYLLYRMLYEYPFFQKADFFALYDRWARAELRLSPPEDLGDKKLQIATEIVALVEAVSVRETDPKISQILLDLWERLAINDEETAYFQAVISTDDRLLIENLRLAGGQKLDDGEIKAIEETLQFEKELEDRLAEIEAPLNLDVVEDSVANYQIQNAPDLLNFFADLDVQVDLLAFRTSRETGTSVFEKFIYKDRFLSGEFEYESQRFLTLNLSSGETYDLVSRTSFEDILNNLDAAIEREKARLSEIAEQQRKVQEQDQNKVVLEAPESSVIQTAEKAVLSRRFAQRMLSALPLELQRHNIMVLDDSYQIFGVWNASSGRAIKLAFTFDQVNGSFSDIQWVELSGDNGLETLQTRSDTLRWEAFEAWLLELQPVAETVDDTSGQ